jgi:hypothetical protein
VLETPHVVVGAAIASKIVNPALALPLALGSHFILDKVPHWNPHTFTETEKYGKPTKQSTVIATIDSLLALGSGFYIASMFLPQLDKAAIILLACFLSVLPDVVKSPFYYLKNRNRLLKKWVEFERSNQVEVANPYIGVLTQIIVISAGFWWILG